MSGPFNPDRPYPTALVAELVDACRHFDFSLGEHCCARLVDEGGLPWLFWGFWGLSLYAVDGLPVAGVAFAIVKDPAEGPRQVEPEQVIDALGEDGAGRVAAGRMLTLAVDGDYDTAWTIVRSLDGREGACRAFYEQLFHVAHSLQCVRGGAH